MKKLMLVINPVAGRGGFHTGFGEVIEIFWKDGYQTTIFMTSRQGDATSMVYDEAEKYDLLVCMGGDGTLSEIISGYVTLESPPLLGYIPMGTANDVATTLNIPKGSAVKAAKHILDGKPTPFDVGLFNGCGYFTYIAAFGAFTDVSYETPQDIKQTIGHLAYFLEGLRRLPSIVKYHAVVEHDGGIIEDDFIFGSVTNSTSVAGMVRLDESVVELGDGLFEVILVRVPKNLTALNRIIGDILTKNYTSDYVIGLHSKEVRFTFDDEVSWTRDGESGGLHRQVELSNLHGAVKLLV